MKSAIVQIIPLSMQWPTSDPFLFCAHHNDDYPSGDGELAPSASLDGRDIGQDFSNLNGWSMYHGSRVPGFPQHPHRGFETITFVRRGLIDHSDSLGATARFGRGDVQWLTAGSGIQHCEMFPLVNTDATNPTELFQIWLNLPASDKMVEPYFTMLWADDIPKVMETDRLGNITTVTVIAGSYHDTVALNPPPNSWAARSHADVAVWHVELEADAEWVLPAALRGSDVSRTLYLFEGGALTVDGVVVESSNAIVLEAGQDVVLRAHDGAVQCMLLQGQPLREPVARYGPFVMNTKAEIQQAFDDYQRTEFGGWPWPTPDPVHPADQQRFAETPKI